ncbi:MAG: hypothetical protein ACPL0B_02135 [Anaerolineales bacterium]
MDIIMMNAAKYWESQLVLIILFAIIFNIANNAKNYNGKNTKINFTLLVGLHNWLLGLFWVLL